MPGWIKIHRQIQDCLIWEDKPFNMAAAWVDLLLLANHEDKEIIFDKKPMLVKRGQRVTSIRSLSDRWGWGNQKTLKFLKMLEEKQMITREVNKRRTLLTIVNYSFYQGDENTDRTLTEHWQNTDRTLTEHSSSINNNDNNDKKNNICSNQNDLNDKKTQKKKPKLSDEENKELVKNFEIIYQSYPRKVGKTDGFLLYKQWLNGRDIAGQKIKLTNKQMWLAIARYKKHLEENETEKQYIKQFDTFMRKPILDYVGDEEQ